MKKPVFRTLLGTLSVITLTLGSLPGHAATGGSPTPGGGSTLPSGTLVVLETAAPISSRYAQVGQFVPVRVKYDVIVGGKVLIKAGSSAQMDVTAATRRRWANRPGQLAMRPASALAVDGQQVPLVGVPAAAGRDPQLSWITPGYALLGPVYLLRRGREAVIPAGYEVTANVASERSIQ